MLAAGKAFAQNAEPLVREFVAHGLPDTFLADLNHQIAEFEQSLKRRDTGRNEKTAAKAGIEAALNAGLAASRRLDILVTNQYKNDSVTLAVWDENRRIEHWRGRKSGKRSTVVTADAPETVEPAALPAKPSPESEPAAAVGDDEQPPAVPALKVAS